ncbi:MAG: hypothetical protein M1836_007687 [Candelina mexicana]|nr:MAG: hypothetical protein M1836_007687 [Candelina mexicana]
MSSAPQEVSRAGYAVVMDEKRSRPESLLPLAMALGLREAKKVITTLHDLNFWHLAIALGAKLDAVISNTHALNHGHANHNERPEWRSKQWYELRDRILQDMRSVAALAALNAYEDPDLLSRVVPGGERGPPHEKMGHSINLTWRNESYSGYKDSSNASNPVKRGTGRRSLKSAGEGLRLGAIVLRLDVRRLTIGFGGKETAIDALEE